MGGEMKGMWRHIPICVLVGALLGPFFVFAHTSLLGSLKAEIEGSVIEIVITFPEERTLDDEELFEKYTQENLVFTNNGVLCDVSVVDFQTGVTEEDIPTTILLHAECAEEIENLIVHSEFFTDVGYALSAFFVKNEFTQSFVFNDENQDAEFTFSRIPETFGEKASAVFATVKQFIAEGMKHIFSGYDHILFVLALLVGVTGLWRLVKIITAFTIAHSITLILSAFDLVSVAPIIVEPLIALSIAYVAFEKYILDFLRKYFNTVKTEVISHRWKVAFGFGLIHGLGFAGVLKEIRIPDNVFVWSLLSFNIGVEIGQIIIIALFFPLLYFTIRYTWQKKAVTIFSILIGSIGLFWFIQRLFF